MGKIRVKALGDAEKEKKQKQEAKQRSDAKKAVKVEQTESTQEMTAPAKEVKQEKNTKINSKKFSSKTIRSKKYQRVAEVIDKKKIYSLNEALSLLPKLQRAKFDESVELHLNLIETGISVSTVLPHGTGKKIRVSIADEEIIAKVEKGIIDFDVLVAEPSMMPKLAKIAKFLGPRGLMPNPKTGTVTTKPEEVVKRFQNGQVNYKSESKFPILHMTIGKVSFGNEKLSENIKTLAEAMPSGKVKNAILKTTMSPAIRFDFTTVV